MSSDTRSPWETAIENLTGPWDLVVISAGVAVAAVAAALGPWSAEDLLPVGAFGGMAILKGAQALHSRRALRLRAEGIGAEHSGIESLPGDRAQFLDKELSLWKKYITTNAEFSQVLDQEAERVRTRRALRKRASDIKDELSALTPPAESHACRVRRELRLWEEHITTNVEFSKLLDQEAEHVRTPWEKEFDVWKTKKKG